MFILNILLALPWFDPVESQANDAETRTLLYSETFDEGEFAKPLFERFPSMEVKDGALVVRQQVKHNASPTLPIPFRNASLRYQFRISDAQLLTCRFEERSRVSDASAHLCRLEIRPDSVVLRVDTPPKDKDRRESVILDRSSQNFSDGKWHSVELLFREDEVTAILDDGFVTLTGKHDHLAEEKIGVFFVVGGGEVALDNLELEALP